MLKLLNLDASKQEEKEEEKEEKEKEEKEKEEKEKEEEEEDISIDIYYNLTLSVGAVLLITLIFAIKMPWYFKITRQLFCLVC